MIGFSWILNKANTLSATSFSNPQTSYNCDLNVKPCSLVLYLIIRSENAGPMPFMVLKSSAVALLISVVDNLTSFLLYDLFK